MNRSLIQAASLQTFSAPHGLPPAAYVTQEMATRGGGFDPATLRDSHARIIAAETVDGLALVVLLRMLNKDDPTQEGFVTMAFDLTGERLYRSGDATDGKLPKSLKTGYREFGEVVDHLTHDTNLVYNAIQRERELAAGRAEYLGNLLEGLGNHVSTDAAPAVDAEGQDDAASPAVAPHVADAAKVNKTQGSRRKA